MLSQQNSRIIIFIIILIFHTVKATDNTYTKLDSILEKYDEHLQNFVAKNDVPGFAIAIVTEKQLKYIKGFGVNKIGEQDSVGIHSVFRIASVSKGFASVLTGLLVNEGILNWDDKVIKYLPDFLLKDSVSTQDLTIRHVLSHTSGLTPHAYDNLIEANYSFDKIMDRLNEVNVHCPVGECFGYQNTVYSLISAVIKAATGKSYTELLKEKITVPLGMNGVSFSKKEMVQNRDRTFPHVRRYGEWISKEVKDTYYNVAPAAGINASIYDMAYWVRALLGGTPDIIAQGVIKEVSKPLVSTPREKYRYGLKGHIRYAAYGLGWRIFDYEGYTMVFHGGSVQGYLAHLAFFPKHNIGIISLQNARFRNNFLHKFIDLYFDIESDLISDEAK